MKHLFIGLGIIFLMSCKTTGQVILIKSDGGLISDKDLSRSFLRAHSPLIAKMNTDTVDLSIDLTGIGSVPNTPTVYPNFQKVVATEGQTFCAFIFPKVYIVFKNGILMDLLTHYTLASNGITFITPLKINDVIKIINMQPQ